MTFLQLESAKGHSETATYKDFEYHYVDFETDFGLQKLSSYDIAALNSRLMEDETMYTQYMAYKQGYKKKATTMNSLTYSCLQMNSMYLEEINSCKSQQQKFDTCSPKPYF